MAARLWDPVSGVKKVHFIMGKVKILMRTVGLTLFLLFVGCTHGGSSLKTENKVQSEDSKINLHPEYRGDFSYLSLNLYYPPFEQLKTKIEKTLQISLKSRGEAHITLISPVEYKMIMSEIPMDKMYALLEPDFKNIQIKFTCLGRGQITKDAKNMSTYFVVVESNEILEARKKIKNLLSKKNPFDPMNYYPHATIGFTDRDLHAEDGVIKNSNSCKAMDQSLLKDFKL